MGCLFCALVLFFVIFSVEASSQSSTEKDDPVCPKDHPLFPYIKLFNDLPEEWKLERVPEKKTKIVCFTRRLTTEIDSSGDEYNKYSGYEITFGLPKKYLKELSLQEHSIKGAQSIINYTPIEEIFVKDDILTKNKIFIRCSKENEEIQTTTEPPTTTNPDLDFLNDLDDICENFDIQIMDFLLNDDVTPEPKYGSTRKNGGTFIDYSTDKPVDLTEENQTESVVLSENIQSRMDVGGVSFIEMTTEITTLINQIVEETTTFLVPTTENDTTTTETTTQLPVMEEITEISKNEETTTEPVPKIDVSTEAIRRNSGFMIQIKNFVLPSSELDCYLIDKEIKYGTCLKPIIPIRIIAESNFPEDVNFEFLDNLENNKEDDEIIVSGKKNCYLLKNLTNAVCPINRDNLTTVIEVDDSPDDPNEKLYFTIEFEGQCSRVSKKVDVIDCPTYPDTLLHLETDHLPDHVRFKHKPGEIDVEVDDIIIHSFSHCLLLKAMYDVDCKQKADIKLNEMTYGTTKRIIDEEPSPSLRFGDYSLERMAGIIPKSFNYEEPDKVKAHLTTPCDEDEVADPISRTTRNLPYPTTEGPEPPERRTTVVCGADDIECLIGRIKLQATKLKSRRTLDPFFNIERTTSLPTKIPDIMIPNSKRFSSLLHSIIDESAIVPSPRSSTLFKPDFIIKVACAEKIAKSSCFYISKYVMQPTFDDPHTYDKIIDKANFPVDVKIIPAPNLNIFAENETIYATSGQEKFVLIKKNEVVCPPNPKDSFYVLDTGYCGFKRRVHKPEPVPEPEPETKAEPEPEPKAEPEPELEALPEPKDMKPTIVKYQKGEKVYCFDFDDDMRLRQTKCPEDLSTVPVLARPQDLKTLCRSQLKNKGSKEQMSLLRRMNIVTH